MALQDRVNKVLFSKKDRGFLSDTGSSCFEWLVEEEVAHLVSLPEHSDHMVLVFLVMVHVAVSTSLFFSMQKIVN